MMIDPQQAPWLNYDGQAAETVSGHSQVIQEAMRPFDYCHINLPNHLQEISRHFFNLAWSIASMNADERQTLMALEHLLIAKDAAVRAEVYR